jgi:RNA polymerase sigma factor (sigma-70 family)
MLRHVVEHLRTVVRGLHPDLTDGQLLARFADKRDEDSFAALIQRYGRLVWGVCRSTLAHTQDAEDAFQQSFLVLARKAASLSRSESIGGWLYRVAAHTAAHTRAANARRSSRERLVGDLPDVMSDPPEFQDWHAVLHQEIAGLPDVYRQALVLCELEGVSRREGARRLGVPEGTLSSRLAAARRLLGERLVRRGLALSVGSLALSVPEALALATVKAVTIQARATPIIALAKGVFMSKCKALVAVSALGLLIGVGTFTYGLGGQEPTTEKAGKSNQVAPPETRKARPNDVDNPIQKGPEDAAALRLENQRLQLELRAARDQANDKAAEAEKLREEAQRQAAKAKVELERERKRMLAVLQELEREKARNSREEDADIERALKEFQEATDKEGKRKALESLQKAVDKLKESVK